MSKPTDIACNNDSIDGKQPLTETEHNNEDNYHIHEALNDNLGNEQVTNQTASEDIEAELTSSEKSAGGVGTEQTTPNTRKSWNSINSGIKKQKVPIAGKNSKDDGKKDEYEFFNELSQRFVQQQDQIINHRNHLLTWFAWITASQLLVINVLIFICIFGDKQVLNILLGFMKFFVGATFLELLGGLLIIVKYVFSHETYDMLKHLTHVEPSTED